MTYYVHVAELKATAEVPPLPTDNNSMVLKVVLAAATLSAVVTLGLPGTQRNANIDKAGEQLADWFRDII